MSLVLRGSYPGNILLSTPDNSLQPDVQKTWGTTRNFLALYRPRDLLCPPGILLCQLELNCTESSTLGEQLGTFLGALSSQKEVSTANHEPSLTDIQWDKKKSGEGIKTLRTITKKEIINILSNKQTDYFQGMQNSEPEYLMIKINFVH